MSRVDWWMAGFLAILFAFAGVDKLAHLQGFITAINSYKILPLPLGKFLAPIVIAAELTIAAGLLNAAWRRLAALMAAALLVVFTAALLVNQLLGSSGACGCWFSINMAQGSLHLVLNVLMIAMSLFVWHGAGNRSGSSPGRSPALGGDGAAMPASRRRLRTGPAGGSP